MSSRKSSLIRADSAQEVYNIDLITFGILSSNMIKKMAVCKIDSPKLTGPGSVYDERMGYTHDSIDSCVTCGFRKECWGHFGYIDLAESVLHPLYYKSIANFLKCFCRNCSRLLVRREQLEIDDLLRFTGNKRFDRILEKCSKVNTCSHCSSPKPEIIYSAHDKTISIEYKTIRKKKTTIPLNVSDINRIFSYISDEDVRLAGYDPTRVHPKNFVMERFLVLPPCSRPPVSADGNIHDDDLTIQIQEIVKINRKLLSDDLSDAERQRSIDALKFRIETFYDNSKNKAKHPTDNRPIMCLKRRLASKGGQMRSNHMGKRVNFSARTVIGPNPTLKLTQVGIPRTIADIETFPEVVTARNIDALTKLVNNGGANYVVTNGGRARFNLEYALIKKGTRVLYGDIIVRGNVKITEKKGKIVLPKKHNGQIIHVIRTDIKLRAGDRLIRNGKLIPIILDQRRPFKLSIGDVVERKLQDGDVVQFNRQPTLHKGSIMAKEIKILPPGQFTIQFNLASTKSFNADFDGDEMNLHIVQSHETKIEVQTLASAKNNIISCQESKPIITIVQDSLISAYLMTQPDSIHLTKSQFCDIIMIAEDHNGNCLYSPERIKTVRRVMRENGKKGQVYSGRGLLSMILPEDFFYEYQNNGNVDEPTVKIAEGVLYEGVLTKTLLGSSHASLIAILHKQYGNEITTKFIDNIQFITNGWLLIQGFTVGLADCLTNTAENERQITDSLARCYTKAQGVEETTHSSHIREIRVAAALSEGGGIGMKIAKNAMGPKNNLVISTRSGAKGDEFNISQIAGLLSQQYVQGQRIVSRLNHGKRTIPHYSFEIDDKKIEYESRGFVRHSLTHGLNPREFYFHAASGREGLITTALGVASSGYVQRRIVKGTEDCAVKYDGTVRDATSRIFQMAYGNDHLDPSKTAKVNGTQQITNISRIAEQLNFRYERGLELQQQESPWSICSEIVSSEPDPNQDESISEDENESDIDDDDDDQNDTDED